MPLLGVRVVAIEAVPAQLRYGIRTDAVDHVAAGLGPEQPVHMLRHIDWQEVGYDLHRWSSETLLREHAGLRRDL